MLTNTESRQAIAQKLTFETNKKQIVAETNAQVTNPFLQRRLDEQCKPKTTREKDLAQYRQNT